MVQLHQLLFYSRASPNEYSGDMLQVAAHTTSTSSHRVSRREQSVAKTYQRQGQSEPCDARLKARQPCMWPSLCHSECPKECQCKRSIMFNNLR